MMKKYGKISITDTICKRLKERMYISLIDTYETNDEFYKQTGYQYKPEDSEKLQESVVVEHLSTHLRM